MLKLKVNPLIALPYTPTKRVDKLTIQLLSISIRTSYSFYKLALNFLPPLILSLYIIRF